MKTLVRHWHYNDGFRAIPEVLLQHYGDIKSEYSEEFKGWHCWVYSSHEDQFEEWMEKNMTGEYDCSFRFNGGNPMYTVTIKEDVDATLFKLKWICET